VPERLDSVDKQYRNLVLVTRKQFSLAFDINFLDGVESDAACFSYLCLHFFAKSTAGFGVKDNLHSRFQLGFPLGQMRSANGARHNTNYPLANAAANVV